jgi:hypothetical protein
MKWRELYKIAVLETSPRLLKQKASDAERAVRARLEEMSDNAADDLEKAELERALDALRVLKDTHWA